MRNKRGEIASGSQALRKNRLWLPGTSVSPRPCNAVAGDAIAGSAARRPCGSRSRGAGQNTAGVTSQATRKQQSFADSLSRCGPGIEVSGSASGSVARRRFLAALILVLERSIRKVQGLGVIFAGFQNHEMYFTYVYHPTLYKVHFPPSYLNIFFSKIFLVCILYSIDLAANELTLSHTFGALYIWQMEY